MRARCRFSVACFTIFNSCIGNETMELSTVRWLRAISGAAFLLCMQGTVNAQGTGGPTVDVTVTIENIAPTGGVAITPVWVGFHSGSFDSYNGGLTSLEGLERIAEDGDTSQVTREFNDFDPERGGYTYIDNSGASAVSALVRTGDLSDVNRVDATLGAAPLLPGQSANAAFELVDDGSNDFFSYLSMVLPSNDFFIANGNPTAHDISSILAGGGEISFLIGTPNGGVNDAGTESEDFEFSAGNGLFPGRNLPEGQTEPNQGASVMEPIANVIGDPFVAFDLTNDRFDNLIAAKKRLLARVIRTIARYRNPYFGIRIANFLIAKIRFLQDASTIDVEGLDFNQYEGGIARVTIVAVPRTE